MHLLAKKRSSLNLLKAFQIGLLSKYFHFWVFSIKIRCHGFKKYTLFLLSFVKIYYSVCTDTERGYLF
jgi:hypothetical protein